MWRSFFATRHTFSTIISIYPCDHKTHTHTNRRLTGTICQRRIIFINPIACPLCNLILPANTYPATQIQMYVDVADADTHTRLPSVRSDFVYRQHREAIIIDRLLRLSVHRRWGCRDFTHQYNSLFFLFLTEYAPQARGYGDVPRVGRVGTNIVSFNHSTCFLTKQRTYHTIPTTIKCAS